MRKTLWGSVAVVCLALVAYGLARDPVNLTRAALVLAMLREVRIPWESIVGPLPVITSGAALLVVTLALVIRGTGGRRRRAERMVRSGSHTTRIARRTGLAQDAVRMLER